MPYVNSLHVKNFYNYYDDVCFDFKQGLNIIVADNNGGKSKLFNAFKWILSDRVFDSDTRSYYEIKNSDKKGLFKIISDKAKYSANQSEKIESLVEIVFTNDMIPAQLKKYRIVKRITAVLKDDANRYDVSNWDIRLENTECFHEDIIDSKPIDENKVLGKLYPEPLKRYYLFQGEEVDHLVSNELTSAIKEIQGIWMYDYLEVFISDIVDKADSDYQRQISKNSSNSSKSNAIKNEIDILNSLIKDRTTALVTLEEQRDKLHERKILTDSEILDLRRQNETTKELQKCETEIDNYRRRIYDFEKNYNEHFFSSKWLLLGFSEIEEKFVELRKQYKNQIDLGKLNEENFTTPLPKGSPDPISLKQMLTDKKCFVCNRSIDKESEPYNHIVALLEKNNSTTKKTDTNDPIDDFLDELYKSFNNFPSENSIKNEKEKLKSNYLMLKKNLSDWSKKENELSKKLKYESDDFEKRWNDHKDLESQIHQIGIEISKLNGNIENDKKQLQYKEIDLKRFATTFDINYEKKLHVLKDIKDAFIRTVDRKYQYLADDLQTSINRIYSNLTRNSDTNPGNVVIKVSGNKKFLSELQNRKGGLLTGQGTAFQRMKQLSIIIGITKMKSNNHYPLIADAPVSEMGEILTQNFFYNVPEHFKQSIVMVKDLYSKEEDNSELNEFGKNLADNASLRPRIYLNTAIGKDQHDRTTKVNLISTGM